MLVNYFLICLSSKTVFMVTGVLATVLYGSNVQYTCVLAKCCLIREEGAEVTIWAKTLASLRPQKDFEGKKTLEVFSLKEPPGFSILDLIVMLNISAKELLCKIAILNLNLMFFIGATKTKHPPLLCLKWEII